MIHRPLLSCALCAVAWAWAATVHADVRLPALFTDHMVLQREQKNRVWGWADPGEVVKVSIGGQTQQTTAGADKKWHVVLDPLPVGGPYTLTVEGKNRLTVQDVLVGEVWICSGQSNMQWSVNASNDPDLEKLAANFPQIRLITVPHVGTQEPQDDFKGAWVPCSPDTVGNFSAVGYFFGRQVHQTLGVPVGLINNAWGGSACEAWIRRDLLAGDPLYQPLLERWENLEKAAADTAAIDQRLKDWEKAVAEAKAAGKQPPPRPQDPRPLMAGNARPGNIYNGVLKPTIGYGIRGAIWYQGESNASRAYQYRELFPLMIKSWRDEWGQGDFSFYYVQLADFREEKPQPGDSDWAELREAQTLTMSKLPKVGQAVIIDIGEGKDIHPKNKQDVAKRLARWALANDYGINLPFRSPEYAAMEKQGSKIVVKFQHVGGGFRPFDTNEIRGFAIAGEDRKWVWAQAKITGADTIEVWNDEVKDPVAVRYAWADNPVCNLYSVNGLPVTPFRTDDWKGITADAR
jgi:sialate O-acetylesterase